MERVLTSLRPLTDIHHTGKKFCVSCGNKATQEGLFEVGVGVTVRKGYCDLCAIIVGGFKPALI